MIGWFGQTHDQMCYCGEGLTITEGVRRYFVGTVQDRTVQYRCKHLTAKTLMVSDGIVTADGDADMALRFHLGCPSPKVFLLRFSGRGHVMMSEFRSKKVGFSEYYVIY